MKKHQRIGEKGVVDVIKYVKCPNCGKSLMDLPKNYPLADLQCSGCTFRAQVKTSKSKPKGVVRGAGWDILGKVLRSGFLVPSLFVNFIWKEKGKKMQEIRFYPFIPKDNLYKYKISAKAIRANYKMFNYKGLNDLPYFSFYRCGN